MSGEKVQELIYDWFREHYPDGPEWQDPDFDCLGVAPIALKMIPAFDAVEYNIGNGGWAQFLWNCFGRWRELIAIAQEGYLLIGAPEQCAALNELRALCQRDERECQAAMTRAADEDDFSHFGTFVDRGYGKRDIKWQEAFFSDSGVYEKRLAWLGANEGLIRKIVGALHA
jgi:hypothetical protein